MKLRKAEAADIMQLVEIRMDYIHADIGEIDHKPEEKIRMQLPDYFWHNLGKSVFCYISEEDGKIIASAFLSVTERPAFPTVPTGLFGTLLNVYTAPEYRHRGIASALVQMAITDGKAKNLSYIELSATEDGKPLYEKIGFKKAESHYTPMKYYFE